MKKNLKFLSLVSLFTLSLSSCGGSKLDSFKKKIDSSIKNVVQVIMNTTIKDGELEVYKREKNIDLIYEGKNVSGVINITEYNLSTNFTYVESKSNDTFEGSIKDLKFGLDLKEKYFTDYTIEESTLSGTIRKDLVSSFFQIEELNCEADPSIEISLEENKISSYTCTYLTNNNKNVFIDITYLY